MALFLLLQREAQMSAKRESLWGKHRILETNSILLLIGILLVVSIGGLVEIAPLFYLRSTIEKVSGMRPYTPLELAGRAIYVREGCYNCQSQMIRTLRDEVERYGHYPLAAESMYDKPFSMGLQTHGSGSRACRRQVFRRLASAASDCATQSCPPVDHARLSIPGAH